MSAHSNTGQFCSLKIQAVLFGARIAPDQKSGSRVPSSLWDDEDSDVEILSQKTLRVFIQGTSIKEVKNRCAGPEATTTTHLVPVYLILGNKKKLHGWAERTEVLQGVIEIVCKDS